MARSNCSSTLCIYTRWFQIRSNWGHIVVSSRPATAVVFVYGSISESACMGNLLPTRRASNGVNSRSSSSNNGGGLPHDVLFEILLRVPSAKQLCRLRAVSRSWRAVLSDPRFAAAHGARHPDPHFAVSVRGILAEEAGVLILDASSGRVVDRAASCAGPSYPRNPPMRAHRGRVLIVGTDDWDDQRRRRRRRLRVLDPATGAVSLLPHHGDDDETFSFFVLGWAAAAASASTGPKGGVSGDRGYYKVLSITDDGGGHGAGVQMSCKVLTLGAGVWREAQKPPAALRNEHACVAAVAGGVVYILARRTRVHEADGIAAFDLETEQWRPAGLLRGPRTSNALSSLTTNTDGRLVAVAGSFSVSGASSVDLWLLVGGGGGEREAVWRKMCTVPMEVERTRPRWTFLVDEEHMVAEPKPLWVLNGGKVAVLVWSPKTVRGRRVAAGSSATGMVTRPNWVLRVYDPRSNCFQDLARRFWYSTDVAVGVYSKNNLLRVQGVRSGLF
ncbi:hypothetical protein U9M48_012161 [Paspalum notatum var. saurae]|uniref:F-box domain-containing protein n=1 Tax=Paspalum notatum var. saurae TaxID=547442 RepID=A0AAQ3SX97_PASNO